MAGKQNGFKKLNIALWIAQMILAIMFLVSGTMKIILPIEQLAVSLPWVNDVSTGLIRLIGISELSGGIGLILPSLLRIQPNLTGWAAIGIAIIMFLALAFHISRSEYSVIGMNIIPGFIALFIAWGRFKKMPIQKK